MLDVSIAMIIAGACKCCVVAVQIEEGILYSLNSNAHTKDEEKKNQRNN